MLGDGQILVAPAYQRQFRWGPDRCSQLIESLILGIPIPNLFMATNEDNTWEVVDGLQRLSAIAKFAGTEELREQLNLGEALALEEMQKLSTFNGMKFDSLPQKIQQHIRTRPLKVVTLNDKSDKVVRFDLFERLNKGGISLSKQEIRGCVFQGQFAQLLDKLAATTEFGTVVKLTSKQMADGTIEECVLRYFAFLDRYRTFDHSVTDFLNDYMEDATRDFDVKREREFEIVFEQLAQCFPAGIKRPGRKGTTPLNLYEGVVVGAALAIRKNGELICQDIEKWLGSKELKEFTTGATNSRRAVIGRIEFCRDRFLGKLYVPGAQN